MVQEATRSLETGPRGLERRASHEDWCSLRFTSSFQDANRPATREFEFSGGEVGLIGSVLLGCLGWYWPARPLCGGPYQGYPMPSCL